MSRRTLWMLGTLAALAAALITIPTLAGAKPKSTAKTHNINLTTQFDAVTSSSTVGAAGDRDRDAGIVTGTIDGKRVSGALVENATWAAGLAFSATGTTFDVNGTTRFKASGKVTVSGTSETISGKLTVIGGTGAYKGATGTLTLAGSAPLGSDTDAATAKATGKLKY